MSPETFLILFFIVVGFIVICVDIHDIYPEPEGFKGVLSKIGGFLIALSRFTETLCFMSFFLFIIFLFLLILGLGLYGFIFGIILK